MVQSLHIVLLVLQRVLSPLGPVRPRVLKMLLAYPAALQISARDEASLFKLSLSFSCSIKNMCEKSCNLNQIILSLIRLVIVHFQ